MSIDIDILLTKCSIWDLKFNLSSMKTQRYFEEERHVIGLLLFVTSNLPVWRLNLGGTKTTINFLGLIFNLLALHHFLRLFNSLLQLSSSLDIGELLKTRPVLSAKRRALDKFDQDVRLVC